MQADSLPAEPQGKPKNTGVGSLSFLQQIFPTQELNWGLLPCRWILYQLSYQRNPLNLYSAVGQLHLNKTRRKILIKKMGPPSIIINILEDAFHCYNCFLNQIDALDCIFIRVFLYKRDFPGSSAGKESTCNAEDPGSIPRLGRSAGERIGYPLQSAWASLVAQLVKNPPAMRETRVQSLSWEDPLEKGMATHSSILAGRIPL